MTQVQDRRVDLAFDKLEGQVAETSSTEWLSRSTGLSTTGSRRLFRRHVGALPGAFLRDLKLAEAYKDLVFSDEAIIDISTRSGFAFQSAFTRAFKERYLLAPTRLRADMVRKARMRMIGSRSDGWPTVVKPTSATMLRRYEIRPPGRQSAHEQSALDQTETFGGIGSERIREELAVGGRALRYFRKSNLLVRGAHRPSVAQIFVEPEELARSAAVEEFMSDRIAVKPLFRDAAFLRVPAASTSAEDEDLVVLVASWVRSQTRYGIASSEWIEQIVLSPTAPTERTIFVPLAQKDAGVSDEAA